MIRVGAIVQARMSSVRLPGKVLCEVSGRPLLAFLLERVACSKMIGKVVLATSEDRQDDPVAFCAESLGFSVYRGSLEDVLDRFYQTATAHGLEHVVRITGDCPLIDPEICDRLIDLYFSGNFDYARTAPSFAEGLDCEILSYEALSKAHAQAKLRSEREHVTLYVRNHPEMFRAVELVNASDEGHYRVTVDNPEDLEVMRELVTHFVGLRGALTVSWPQVRAFLDKHPGTARKNSHLERNEGLKKSLMNDGICHG